MAIDWGAAKAEFILHPEVTYAQLAAKYRCHHASLRRIAAQEHWVEQRRKQSYNVLQTVTQKVVFSQSEELARCNASHLDLSRDLEQAAKQRLERADELTDNGLRCVSVVAEAAQRIAWSSSRGGKNLHISQDPYAQMTDAELAAELGRMGIEPNEPTVQ